ncbi:MAG: hypothetical protein LUQ22_00820 [Methanotrichaceae archaeon]|nr:hypothetical protein [Methanotrichaceae archaeon]
MIPQDFSTYPSINGTIIYTLIYSISKEVKEANDEVVKPVRSAPLYEENFLRFNVARDSIVKEIGDRKIAFDLKIFEDTNLIIEAQTPFNLKDTRDLFDLKKTLFQECKNLASEFYPSQFFEEYLFFCVKDFEDDIDSYISAYGEIIAAILKDESIKLAQKEIDDTLATNIRYGRQDITIVDWDGAFLIDAFGEFEETIAVLELANIQLLNFRILNKKLAEEIDLLEWHTQPPGISSFLHLSPFMNDVIKIRSQSVLELENIESALKLYGDWYSGKLYDLASKKFHLNTWRMQVGAKLEALADLYEMVEHTMTERFNLILEFLIVVLIVLEIVLAILGK